MALLLATLAIAPATNAALVDQAQQTLNGVTGTRNPIVDQVQSTIDQVQGSLGPLETPTKGPVDQAQSSVNNAVPTTGSPAGSNPTPTTGSPTPAPIGSSGSPTSPRASGGSPTSRSRGGPVSARAARARRAAARRRAAVGAAAAAAALTARQVTSGHPKPQSNAGNSSDPVTHTLTKLVKVVPGPIKLIIGLLAALAALLALRSWLHGRRARRLERQREELLDDVGLLQRALLPDVPDRIGPLATSVAYRPAEGPAAGGDFYDVFEIEDGRVAVIVGDVCGHGRQALAQTALIRYTLRAYIDAGLGPRTALQVAGRALANDLAGELTTVVVAVYDRHEATLTYACAGHEPPILLGPAAHEPVIAGAAPPVAAGVETGMRDTRVPLPAGSIVCFFTDGLVEARVEGGMLGRRRLVKMLSELGDWDSAGDLLARLAEHTQRATDDMAACIIRAVDGAPSSTARVEQLEVRAGDDWARHARSFLAGSGIRDEVRVEQLLRSARLLAAEFGAAILRVTVDGGGPKAEVVEPDMSGVAGVLPPLQPGDASNTIAL